MSLPESDVARRAEANAGSSANPRQRWRIVFHLLKEKTHDKKEARKRKGLANGDGIGGRERSLLKQFQWQHGMACGLFSEQEEKEEEDTCCICRKNKRRNASQAVSFNQRKGQHPKCENTCPGRSRLRPPLRSRWSHITGGEQKAEDADGKIEQEDAAPTKRVDQHPTKQRTRKDPDACDCCPDANRLRPFPGVRKGRLQQSERIRNKQGCAKPLEGSRDLQDEERWSKATQR